MDFLDPATIVAISTPAGRGGLGIVRLSGAASLPIARELLQLGPVEPRRAQLARFRDADGAVLDEVIVTWYQSPRSATAEDVVEISAHGSPVLLNALLERAMTCGARLAEPGEFTRRAFLHGRLDLTQAEAVRDLIDAHTLFQARTAARQMQGSVACVLRPLHRRVTELIARLEAGIDFADDDVSLIDEQPLRRELAALQAECERLAASFTHGRTVREGVTLAIIGRPNVGKSSLFNRLLSRPRAIVTAEAGTTRDLVSESLDWEGIPVRLVDTAGIRAPEGEAERQGIEKSWEAAADADLVLAVFDGSEPLTVADRDLLSRVAEWPQAVVVVNKSDLRSTPGAKTGAPQPEFLPAFSGEPERGYWLSAKTGEGVEHLRAQVRQRLLPESAAGAEFITNARHAQHLSAAGACFGRGFEAAAAHWPHEVLLVDLYAGLRELEAITGQTTVEDILGVIFSTFCIGK